jgi:predicted dehydrogenase
MVSRWYFGRQATAALGLRANLDSHWGDADDNGVIVVRFPDGIALLEGSWTTMAHGVPTGPIVYGTRGTLVVERQGAQEVVRVERGHGDTTTHVPEPLPAGRRNVAEEYVHHLESGEPLHPTLEMTANLEYMAILDAGIRSAVSGKLEPVDNATWRIG